MSFIKDYQMYLRVKQEYPDELTQTEQEFQSNLDTLNEVPIELSEFNEKEFQKWVFLEYGKDYIEKNGYSPNAYERYITEVLFK